MSLKALNQLLGRSTIDPLVIEAYKEGRIDDLIAEYDFSPEIRRELYRAETDNFSQFAALAYQVVEAFTEARYRMHVPSPTEGLQPEKFQADEEQVA